MTSDWDVTTGKVHENEWGERRTATIKVGTVKAATAAGAIMNAVLLGLFKGVDGERVEYRSAVKSQK